MSRSMSMSVVTAWGGEQQASPMGSQRLKCKSASHGDPIVCALSRWEWQGLDRSLVDSKQKELITTDCGLSSPRDARPYDYRNVPSAPASLVE